MMNQQVCDAINRIDEVGTCLQAVTDLLAPAMDFSVARRDNLAVLMQFLQREYASATDEARRALRSA